MTRVEARVENGEGRGEKAANTRAATAAAVTAGTEGTTATEAMAGTAAMEAMEADREGPAETGADREGTRRGSTEAQQAMLRRLLERNQQTLQDKIDELSLLRVVNEALASESDVATQMRRVTEQLARLTGTEEAEVFVVRGRWLRSLDNPARKLHVGDGILGKVAMQEQGRCVADTLNDPDASVLEAQTAQALFAFPLLFARENLGVIALWTNHPETLGSATERVLRLLSAQLAIAVKNMSLIQELQAAQRYRDALFNGAPDALVSTNILGAVQAANRQVERIWGIEAGKLRGNPVADGLEHGEELAEIIAESIATGAPLRDRRLRLGPRAAGESACVDVEVTAAPVHSDAGEVMGALTRVTCINERTRRERRRIAAERLAADGRRALRDGRWFGAALAAMEELLERLSSGEEAAREELTRVVAEARQEARRLTRLAHFEARSQEIDLNALVRDAVDALRLEPGARGAALEMNLHHSDPRVRAVPEQLELALRELFCNAVAARSGCRIRIRTTRAEGERVRIEVADNGPGLPPEAARAETASDGCGLALVRRILEQHGSRLEIEPGGSGGACFSWTLPLATNARRAPSGVCRP